MRADVNLDTDQDGFPDAMEVSSGHDPADANENPDTSAIVRSNADFTDRQGVNGWFYGYRNFTIDGGGKDYDARRSFIQFKPEEFAVGQWDLNTEASEPWTEIGRENTRPNGDNSGPVHWTVRRWMASSLIQVTPVALHWHLRKSDLSGGNGVTGALHINGKQVDAATIAFDDSLGVYHTFYATLAPTDIVDLVHRPTGKDGRDADDADGSINWLLVDRVLPALAFQPDGTPFFPAGREIRFESATFDADGKTITLVWTSVPGAQYALEVSEDLKNWTVFDADVPSGGHRTTYSEKIDAAAPVRFYRLRQ
jgi:hypothetical protein